MATKRTLSVPVKAFLNASYLPVAVFTGAGAAAPIVSTLLRAQFNYASTQSGVATTIVRNGAGDYSFTFPEAPAVTALVLPVVDGTANLKATLGPFSTTGNRLTVRVFTATPAGVATDITAAENLRLLIFGGDSSV